MEDVSSTTDHVMRNDTPVTPERGPNCDINSVAPGNISTSPADTDIESILQGIRRLRVEERTEDIETAALSDEKNRQNPHYYWNHVAPSSPKAQILARQLGLQFPTPRVPKVKESGERKLYRALKYVRSTRRILERNEDALSICSCTSTNYLVSRYPVLRLVATGQDTPDLIAMLLGPSWQTYTSAVGLHQACRMRALLHQELEGRHPFNKEMTRLNEGLPNWSLRPPNEMERLHVTLFKADQDSSLIFEGWWADTPGMYLAFRNGNYGVERARQLT